jgi:hypothetical protein
MGLGHSISSDSLILAFANQDSLLKDRKFQRSYLIGRESKWPRILEAVSSAREVRLWPKAAARSTGNLAY